MNYVFPRKIPSEIIQYIYELCIDKRIYWGKVTEQFLKGGFNRKNLKILPFIEKQKILCKQVWLYNRPELSLNMTRWNPITNERELCPFEYRNGEWDIKNKQVIVTFKTRRGFWNKWSSKDPVSRWLKNIKKFETAGRGYVCVFDNLFYPRSLSPLYYLPKEKNNFGIKFKSQFYKERAKKNKKIKEKEKDKKNSGLFIEERKKLKIENSPFIKGQTVNLMFTFSNQYYYRRKIYKGKVTGIWFKQHRDDNNRLIFKKPRGNNKFIPDIVDNYIGELYITVKFEDNEIRHYTIEKLLLRIQVSKHQLLHKKNLENIRKNSKPISNCVLNQQS